MVKWYYFKRVNISVYASFSCKQIDCFQFYLTPSLDFASYSNIIFKIGFCWLFFTASINFINLNGKK